MTFAGGRDEYVTALSRSVLMRRKETRNCEEVRGYEAGRDEDGVTGYVCGRG